MGNMHSHSINLNRQSANCFSAVLSTTDSLTIVFGVLTLSIAAATCYMMRHHGRSECKSKMIPFSSHLVPINSLDFFMLSWDSNSHHPLNSSRKRRRTRSPPHQHFILFPYQHHDPTIRKQRAIPSHTTGDRRRIGVVLTTSSTLNRVLSIMYAIYVIGISDWSSQGYLVEVNG